jgi:hypothetical protein
MYSDLVQSVESFTNPEIDVRSSFSKGRTADREREILLLSDTVAYFM